MKLLLEHREEKYQVNFHRKNQLHNQFLATSLKYTDRTWIKMAFFSKLQFISILTICSQR